MKNIQEQIKALQAEQAAREVLQNDLPAGLPEPELIVWHHSSLSEFGMTYKIKTLDEAREIISAWDGYILPLNLTKGTFTSFRTPEHKPERGEKESTPVFPVTVNVSYWGIEFKFYAMVNGHLLNVEVETEHGAPFHQYASVRFQVTYSTSKTGRNTKHTDKSIVILDTPAFQGYRRIKWWGSGDYPNDYTLYWTTISELSEMFTEEF